MNEIDFPSVSASLPVRFVIYLPAAKPLDEDGAAIEDAVARILCERFGGVTAYPARGTFALTSGTPQTEPITVMETYCDEEAWQEHRRGIATFAAVLAQLLRQESMGCSVNGRMVLINAPSQSVRGVSLPSTIHGADVYSLLQRAFD